MIIGLSLLIAILGLVVYLVTDHPKAQELARISFFAGLLVFFTSGPRSCLCAFGLSQ